MHQQHHCHENRCVATNIHCLPISWQIQNNNRTKPNHRHKMKSTAARNEYHGIDCRCWSGVIKLIGFCLVGIELESFKLDMILNGTSAEKSITRCRSQWNNVLINGTPQIAFETSSPMAVIVDSFGCRVYTTIVALIDEKRSKPK